MTQPQEKGWTYERGYAIPPAAEKRDITNQPMQFKPVRIGQNTFPGSNNPGGEVSTPKEEIVEPAKETPESLQEEAPKLLSIPTDLSQSAVVDKSSGPSLEQKQRPQIAETVIVRVEWQGCVFNVAFDNVWLQTAAKDSSTIRWLTLVHDATKHPTGPVWTPPSTVSEEPVTLKITYDSTEYTCSYFGLELFVPVCDLSLTTFLVMSQQ